MSLTKEDIINDLRALGVGPGMTIMAHSSLSSLGHVEGGAETLIEALIEAVGPEGTVAMPAMPGSGVFDVETSPSTVGTVTEVFRTYPGVKRSFHPSHSACAIGPKADYLLADTLQQPTAVGVESPWGRLSRLSEGYVLLLGVDQDRNTLLHHPEEIVRAPYLSTIERQYVDEHGNVQTKTLELFPGPHRDFIGLEPLLREGRAMRIGKVGDAVARLMHAGTTVEIVVEALREDPAAVLCDNPNCDDCVMQRAKLKAHDLAQHDFTASALLDELVDDLRDARDGGEWAGGMQAVWNEGVRAVELGEALGAQLIEDQEARQGFLADLAEMEMSVSCLHCGLSAWDFVAQAEFVRARVVEAGELARAMGAPLVKVPAPPPDTDPAAARARLGLACEAAGDDVTVLFENTPGSIWDTGEACDAPLLGLADDYDVGFAFNPAHFANVGEKPFLGTYRDTKLKRYTRIIYATDGCVPGRPQYTLPLEGNGEVKEVISIFRARCFDGFVTLKMGDRRGPGEFRRQAEAFRRLLETS
ncbi:MAG: AAC(3) family N-acetyltransferase [Armatimonadota bacterium]|nr:AAC(3) family N-acetyltransferase [Armatimonadota bacterium]